MSRCRTSVTGTRVPSGAGRLETSSVRASANFSAQHEFRGCARDAARRGLVQLQYEVLHNLVVEAGAPPKLRKTAAGANVIGACCGSTPAHLRAMVEAVR